MSWEVIKKSAGVRIMNIPEFSNNDLIASFLSSKTTEIESIEIKGSYADVNLRNDDEIEDVLELSGRELLGYIVTICSLIDEDDFSEPEILTDDADKPSPQALLIGEHNQLETILQTNVNIENSMQLRDMLQGISLKPRRILQENDSFEIIMDAKLVVLVTMATLIVLTFLDIFG